MKKMLIFLGVFSQFSLIVISIAQGLSEAFPWSASNFFLYFFIPIQVILLLVNKDWEKFFCRLTSPYILILIGEFLSVYGIEKNITSTLFLITIFILTLLSFLEIYSRFLTFILGKESEENGFMEWIFNFMDRTWKTPLMGYVPGGDTLELVVKPSKAQVAEEVGIHIPKATTWMILVPLGLTLFGGMITTMTTCFQTLSEFSSEMVWQWEYLVGFGVIGVILSPILGPGTAFVKYLISEWERRNTRLIFYREYYFLVGYKFPGTPYLLRGTTARIGTTKMGSPGEKSPEERSRTFLGQVWDGMILWNPSLLKLLGIQWTPPWRKTGLIYLPVPTDQGEARMAFADYADNILVILARIATETKETYALEKRLGSEISGALLDPDLVDPPIYFSEGESAEELVEQFLDLFASELAKRTNSDKEEILQTLQNHGEVVDLMSLEDPGRCDVHTGTCIWMNNHN